MADNQAILANQPIIEKIAIEQGLDFFPIVYEVVDSDTISQLAGYGGFPVRYPHWRWGMEYDQLDKGYRYGLQKIYEMVINTNPVYAYLLNVNQMVDHKLVMAHVCGHADFFKHNLTFQHTDRKMMDKMANHAIRIRNHINKHGLETVEQFIETCLTIDNLIDPVSQFIKPANRKSDSFTEPEKPMIKKLNSKEYMDGFINPSDFLKKRQEKMNIKYRKETTALKQSPPKPSRDVMMFLLENAPLKPWEQDVLAIIREESYYFNPQGATKIMNEGWATYWHSELMTMYIMDDSEIINFADHHSGTVHMHPGRLNPYAIGLLLFRDIKERWDKGRFGKDWEDCDDRIAKKNWDKKLNKGLKKIFEVRKYFSDITFIDNFLTEDFVRKHKLFATKHNPKDNLYRISSREFKAVKKSLLSSLTNLGQPIIQVVNGNYKNRGDLMLKHQHDQTMLDLAFAHETMKAIGRIWKRPVHIDTIDETGKKLRISNYKGEIEQKKLD